MRKIKDIEADLRALLDEMRKVRDGLSKLEQTRTKLVKEYRAAKPSMSSSVVSSEKIGSHGVIQGPPPRRNHK